MLSSTWQCGVHVLYVPCLKNMLIVNISLNQLEAVQTLRLDRRCRGLARPSAVTIDNTYQQSWTQVA